MRRLSGAGGLRAEAAVMSGGALAATGVAGVASIVIARTLGVSDRGLWAVVASSAVLAATIAALGLPEGAAYGTARSSGRERGLVVAACTAAAAVLGVGAALAVAVALALQDGTDTAALVAAGAAVGAAAVLTAVVLRLVQVALGAAPFALLGLLSPCAVLAAVLVLAAVGDVGPAAVGAISAACSFAVVAIALVVLRRRGALDPAGLRPRKALTRLRPLLAYSAITFATLALTHVVQRVDVLLVNGYEGSHAAGLYAVAVQFADLLLVVPAALGLVVFRRGASAPGGAWPDFLRVVRWATVCAAGAAAVLMLLADPVLPLLVGDAYAGAVDATRILAPGAAILGVQSVVSHYVASRGRPAAVLAAWTAGALLTVLGNLWAIPRHGIEGAAAVSSASYVLVLGLHVVAVRRVRDADRERHG